jgi:hypothetical protein
VACGGPLAHRDTRREHARAKICGKATTGGSRGETQDKQITAWALCMHQSLSVRWCEQIIPSQIARSTALIGLGRHPPPPPPPLCQSLCVRDCPCGAAEDAVPYLRPNSFCNRLRASARIPLESAVRRLWSSLCCRSLGASLSRRSGQSSVRVPRAVEIVALGVLRLSLQQRRVISPG